MNLNNKNMETKIKKADFYKVSNRVWLEKNKKKVNSNFIPKHVPFQENKKATEQVAISISKNMPVLLIGETGTGKTSLVRHLAYETGNAFMRVNHNGGTTVEDIIGRWLLNENGQTVWVDGVLIEAMKNGYWYLADEINSASAEINFVYHSLLDDDGRVVLAEKGNEVVIPHENFRFFGAMNPPAEYAGTKELNKALMSRFMVMKVDFPSPATETKILVERTGIEKEVAEKLVAFAGDIRVLHIKEQVRFVLSTRDLLMWATMFKVYGKYLTSAEMTVLNKISQDDFDVIKDSMQMKFKAFDDRKAPEQTEEETTTVVE